MVAPEEARSAFPSLRGRVVIVTGGSSGIGAAVCGAFARQGSAVASIDVLVPASRPGVHHYTCDLLDIDALTATLKRIVQEVGPPLVLVNNAGNDDRHALGSTTPEDWERITGTNLRHMFFAAQFVGERMKAAGAGGAIVNLGSIAWMVPEAGMPVYLVSKAAVHGLTRALARDLGEWGIRANTVAPGWVMTERQRTLWLTPEAEAQLEAAQMLPGRIQPEDVAELVLFLASDRARMITGQQFILDGGRI